MKIKFLTIATLFVGLALLPLSSCKKDNGKEPKIEKKKDKDKKEEDKTPLTVKEIKNYNLIDDIENWHYYSFEKGEFVGTGSANPNDKDDAKWKKRTDWDIAFHHFHVRTNSGTSGDGKGGMLRIPRQDFDSIKAVPENAIFKTDELVDKRRANFYTIATTSNTTLYDANINTVGSFFWTVTDFSGLSDSKYIKDIFLLKTASGKYVKFQYTGIIDDIGQIGFMSMQYVYQSDGSKDF